MLRRLHDAMGRRTFDSLTVRNQWGECTVTREHDSSGAHYFVDGALRDEQHKSFSAAMTAALGQLAELERGALR